jgi:beta-lactamase class A
VPTVSAGAPSPSPAVGHDPFDAAVRAYVDGRQGTVTAAVYDEVTGKTYTFHPGVQIICASIVKVAIMAAVLRDAGNEDRFLTSAEADELASMIEISDNDAATALWREIGFSDGMRDFVTAAGMSDTVPDPAGRWGLSETTALDQVKLVRDLAFRGPILRLASQAYGLSLMQHVVPEQYWGVSGGIPSGVAVALKNGWLPIGPANWVMNSVGYVQGSGRNYVIAVLSRDDPTFGYGVQTIDQMSAMIWHALRP